MNLLDLQHKFSAEIRSASLTDFGEAIAPGMSVYRNNYRGLLHSALRDTFQRVRLWLGENEFQRVAEIHIGGSPPRSWTLDAYGRDFPRTMQRLFPKHPEIPELAWLDLALAEAFVAADAEPIVIEELNGIDWDKAQLTFVPSLNLTRVETNAAAIWKALFSGERPPPSERLQRPGAHLAWRKLLTSQFRLVSSDEHRAIAALRLGLPFGLVCSELSGQLGDEGAAEAAGEMLGRWLADALIAQIRTG